MIAWRDALSLAALLLVPLLAAFLVWAERRRRRDLERFVAAPLVGAVVPGIGSAPRRLRAGVLLLAVAGLVVAIAGPLWGFRWQEVRREGIDLVVALDTSRSMLASDVKPNRLARAKLALRDVLDQLEGDRIALVAFAGTAFVQCPLTLDYGVFTQALDALDAGIIPLGGTAVATAIDTALEAFEGRQGKHQAIVLITDGEDHEGTAVDAAKRAQERGVKVFTVGIGTPEGELIPVEGGGWLKDRAGNVVKSRLDETTLQDVAVESGGVYVRAAGPSLGLPDLYRDYVATMEKRELGSTLERRWEHRYQVPLALVLLLLLVEARLGDRVGARRRPAWLARVLPALLIVLGAAAPVGAAWLDRDAVPREAARLYDAGEFEAAAAKYNESLIDEPDRMALHFNLGAAEYRRGEWEPAARAFGAVVAADPESALGARAAYNLGNVRFRQGQSLAGPDPQGALEHWGEALVAYRLAMNAAPDFEDPKYNYELVQRRMEELREQLERERQEQEQQEQEQEQEQEPQEQEQEQEPQAEEPRQEQDQQDGQQEEQQRDEQQQAQDDPGQDEAPPRQAQPDAPESEAPPQEQAAAEARPPSRMTPEEARALLDAGQEEELTPEEMHRGAVVTGDAPLRDW